jgi:hypothetical protein
MRPAFGILRHVERRVSNETMTENTGSTYTMTKSHYQILVTRIVVFWITVWTHETDWA